ncbi:UDP-N-acetylmuramoyl-L-alanyl-D-glutamate--2,6-diaminopimelate ligase [Acidovorax lacteus]|uniref:UDP-N-acetylmuramoyl-L-alanyl-D-glutamate--2,6-diaminopimelate ligase n=2 Tax=Acidovorax lacteus TaxID=1924988 RepID=A0ABP8KZP5_9BURK
MTQRMPTLDALEVWLRTRCTGALRIDSRQVQPGDAFVAWPGAATDGRHHVADALVRGASASVVEHEGVQAFDFGAADVVSFAGLKAATGWLAARWWGQPSAALHTMAVTGTNGKTSTSWWLAQAWTALADRGVLPAGGCAVVGTLGVGVPGRVTPTGLTTPDPVRLQQSLRGFADQGLRACAMEASSIGLAEERMAGLQLHTALFTNFTQDHLDYHGSMAAYWAAKRRLFDWPGLRAAVINRDDPAGAALIAALAAAPLDVWSISLHAGARLQADDIRTGQGGLAFDVLEAGQRVCLQSRVVGRYNVLNLLGVIGALRAAGVPLADAVAACADLAPVPGRMQSLDRSGQPLVVVDYAHTPDALSQALAALRPQAAERGGALCCVFGCGGDRDAGKRPLMGAAAQQGADRVIVTSDNPRSEDPAAIVHQILQGTIAGTTVQAELDRAAAIARAVREAGPHDVVLIAGKGHEDYQEMAGERRPFSDWEHAQAALNAREEAA